MKEYYQVKMGYGKKNISYTRHGYDLAEGFFAFVKITCDRHKKHV